MDGMKLHRAMRGTPGLERVPFLFVSAFDDAHAREAVKDLRCDGFLRKTTPTLELLAWVRFFVIPEAKRALARGREGSRSRPAPATRCDPARGRLSHSRTPFRRRPFR